MKQKLLKTMLLLSALAVGSSSVWADSETFTAGTDKGETSVTKGVVTVSMSTMSRDDNYRTYASTDMTVEVSSGYLITEVAVTCTASGTSNYGPGKFSSSDGNYSYSGTKGTWSDDDGASSVTLSASTQVRMTNIVVTYKSSGGGSEPSVTTDPTSIDAPYSGDDGVIEVSYNNFTLDTPEVVFCNSDGSTPVASNPSWISIEIDKDNNVSYVVGANTGAARTAYIKVDALDDEAEVHSSDPITITQEAYVAVTGVTLDEDELSLEVGGTATLTATITPSTASNKAVSWESDDTDVATVDSDGKVIAVGVGTANITVTSDDDDDYYATCEVTVTASPALTLDLSQTSWGFPADYKTAAGTYTNNGYSFTVGATAVDGHKAMMASTVQKGIIFGKNGAMITFTALPFNVTKIKVYGLSGAASGVKFNIFVYDEEKAVDVAVSSEATGSNSDHEFVIAAGYQAAGTVYKLKLTTTDKNCQISKIAFYGENVPVTIGAAGYVTFSAPCAVDFSATALEVYTAAVNGGKTAVTLTSVAGKKVPANNAVILKGATATGKVAASASALVGNELLVSDGSVEGDGSTIFALGYKSSKAGFYLVGDGVKVPAGKAYLDLSGSGVKEFLSFEFGDDPDGINSLTPALSEGEEAIYNLAGQRLSKMQKGINIVNGKKILK